jgi:ABC-type Fe3+-siderophore transport system permease subunit
VQRLWRILGWSILTSAFGGLAGVLFASCILSTQRIPANDLGGLSTLGVLLGVLIGLIPSGAVLVLQNKKPGPILPALALVFAMTFSLSVLLSLWVSRRLIY